MSVLAVIGVPASSLACCIKDCSPSTTATPFREVLNEGELNDTGEQINSEPTRQRGTFTDDVLMFIECRRDMIGGKFMSAFRWSMGIG